MSNEARAGLCALVFCLAVAGSSPASGAGAGDKRAVAVPAAAPLSMRMRALGAFGRLPVVFEANRGQMDRRGRFLSRGIGHTLFLTGTEAVLTLRMPAKPAGAALKEAIAKGIANADRQAAPPLAILRMGFAGADPKAWPVGLEPLPGTAHYYVGDDPKGWLSGVPTFAKVRYAGLYRRIDLVFRAGGHGPAFDFIVGPGGDPQNIRLSFKGVERLEIDAEGGLLLKTGDVELRQPAPIIYQERRGQKVQVKGGYVLHGGRDVGFRVATTGASPWSSTRRSRIRPMSAAPPGRWCTALPSVPTASPSSPA